MSKTKHNKYSSNYLTKDKDEQKRLKVLKYFISNIDTMHCTKYENLIKYINKEKAELIKYRLLNIFNRTITIEDYPFIDFDYAVDIQSNTFMSYIDGESFTIKLGSDLLEYLSLKTA